LLDDPTTDFSPYLPPWGQDWPSWMQWANALPNLSEINLQCEQISAGYIRLRLEKSRWGLTPIGGVNGGLVIAAADQAMGIVALTVMPRGALPATATLNASYFRPAMPPLTFQARVTESGRRLVFVKLDVEDRAGRVCVSCSGAMAAQSDTFT